MSNLTRLKNRAALVAALVLSALGASPLANAGTYTVDAVEWVPVASPGTGTDGGYVRFGSGALGENPLDVLYGMDRYLDKAHAPNGAAVHDAKAPSCVGLFRWHVRWSGAASEAHPVSVLAQLQYKGAAYAEADATSNVVGASSSASVTLNDPYFNVMAAASNPDGFGNTATDLEAAAGNGSNTEFDGTSSFTAVSGTTNDWEAYVQVGVNSVANPEAYGAVDSRSHPQATANAYIDLAATVRLTHVGGQRVQADL